jgi:hypothetical protein
MALNVNWISCSRHVVLATSRVDIVYTYPYDIRVRQAMTYGSTLCQSDVSIKTIERVRPTFIKTDTRDRVPTRDIIGIKNALNGRLQKSIMLYE